MMSIQRMIDVSTGDISHAESEFHSAVEAVEKLLRDMGIPVTFEVIRQLGLTPLDDKFRIAATCPEILQPLAKEPWENLLSAAQAIRDLPIDGGGNRKVPIASMEGINLKRAIEICRRKGS